MDGPGRAEVAVVVHRKPHSLEFAVDISLDNVQGGFPNMAKRHAVLDARSTRARPETGCDRHQAPSRSDGMSDTPEASRVPKMTPEEAQEIACALKGLAQSYARAGMARHATRAERDGQW